MATPTYLPESIYRRLERRQRSHSRRRLQSHGPGDMLADVDSDLESDDTWSPGDETDSLGSSASAESSDYGYDLDAELEEIVSQLKFMFGVVLVPFAGRWLGRRVSFWGKQILRTEVAGLCGVE
ncbi:hypothetical protein H4R34_003971 [Dimargaris verticillata]|uniref:Uncharacterized protein n=1 Tax=Dimargaris verticillata TaxID=2761393 RepID=A0A9W8AZU7_9FUNG|nr:hypothetical protein H4R34_003971 [Dimargaris verticillata]